MEKRSNRLLIIAVQSIRSEVVEKAEAELLRRLGKGRKAIEAMEKLLKDREQALSRSERLELLNCYLSDYKKKGGVL